MRLTFFIFIAVLSFMLPWWLVVPMWAMYMLVCSGYELIVLGILLDAYFGYAGTMHMFYTAVATLLCIASLLIRPRLTFYREQTL